MIYSTYFVPAPTNTTITRTIDNYAYIKVLINGINNNYNKLTE